jgi:hypothetical protein
VGDEEDSVWLLRGDYEMLRFSGCKQIFFESLIDLRHIRVEEICVVDVFFEN